MIMNWIIWGNTMDKTKRIRMIKAMEYIVRNLNDESIMDGWLMCGVPDGDIEYGDLADDNYDDDYFMDNENFADLMALFLRLMKRADVSGLYCDGVVSA